nr:MAG TPA: hypothetical protein [Caudoviricetes sp.]
MGINPYILNAIRIFRLNFQRLFRGFLILAYCTQHLCLSGSV